MTEIPREDWFGCYDDSWTSAPLLAEAYQHPAKCPFGLADRIYRHMLAEGWIKPGDKIVDPFGGVGGLGFHAALYGLHWTGCELEARFVELGDMEYDCPGFSKDFWRRYSKRPAFIAKLRAEHKLCPSCETALAPKTVLQKRTKHDNRHKFVLQRAIPSRAAHVYRGNIPLWRERYAPVIPGYGSARLVQGDSRWLRRVIAEADAAVSSPPYVESLKPETDDQTARKQERIARAKSIHDGRALEAPSPGKASMGGGYGVSAGQLGSMPAGIAPATYIGVPADSIVSSPPYAQARIDGHGDEGASGMRAEDGSYLRGPDGWQQRKAMGGRYGDSDGNLANLPAGKLADSVVSSPPYTGKSQEGRVTERDARRLQETGREDLIQRLRTEFRGSETYGKETPGQLGSLPTGNFDASVASPPYAQAVSGMGGPFDFSKTARDGDVAHQRHGMADHGFDYGSSPGQLADLPVGDYDASVASLPYENALSSGEGPGARYDFKTHSPENAVKQTTDANYGADPDNLGNSDKETFWSAARTILEETYAILKPGVRGFHHRRLRPRQETRALR